MCILAIIEEVIIIILVIMVARSASASADGFFWASGALSSS